jgi:hypothetical protein
MACWYCGGPADVLTAGQIADRLETHPKLVQRWIYLGDLDADRLEVGPGVSWRISGDAFWRFLERNQRWMVRLAGGNAVLAARRQAAERRKARQMGGVMQATSRPNVYDQFVHRRGGPNARKAFYECRQCGARVPAAYVNGAPDIGRVKQRLTLHLATHGDALAAA